MTAKTGNLWWWSSFALQRQSTDQRDKPRGPKENSTKEGTFHWHGVRPLLLRFSWGIGPNQSSRRVLANTNQLRNTRSGLVIKILLLLLLALPVMASPKHKIQVRNQFGGWQQYQTVHHLPSASRTAQSKASQSGKQYRIVDEDGNLMDLFYP